MNPTPVIVISPDGGKSLDSSWQAPPTEVCELLDGFVTHVVFDYAVVLLSSHVAKTMQIVTQRLTNQKVAVGGVWQMKHSTAQILAEVRRMEAQ